MMKKAIMTGIVMAGMLSASAYDYPYLTMQTANGTETSVSADGLVLTVTDGHLVATNGDGTTTFTLADLSKMYFSATSQGVSTPVTAFPADDTQVEAYTTGGILAGRFDSMTTAKSSLRSGIYVMKTNGKTLKITVK